MYAAGTDYINPAQSSYTNIIQTVQNSLFPNRQHIDCRESAYILMQAHPIDHKEMPYIHSIQTIQNRPMSWDSSIQPISCAYTRAQAGPVQSISCAYMKIQVSSIQSICYTYEDIGFFYIVYILCVYKNISWFFIVLSRTVLCFLYKLYSTNLCPHICTAYRLCRTSLCHHIQIAYRLYRTPLYIQHMRTDS